MIRWWQKEVHRPVYFHNYFPAPENNQVMLGKLITRSTNPISICSGGRGGGEGFPLGKRAKEYGSFQYKKEVNLNYLIQN